jgi:hypothetical protein
MPPRLFACHHGQADPIAWAKQLEDPEGVALEKIVTSLRQNVRDSAAADALVAWLQTLTRQRSISPPRLGTLDRTRLLADLSPVVDAANALADVGQ